MYGVFNDPNCPAPFFTSPFLMALDASGAYHFDKRCKDINFFIFNQIFCKKGGLLG